MNLIKLFELQQQADERWKDEPDRLEKDILWLKVELGELANEWRGFKYRYPEERRKPRYEIKCHACRGNGGFITGEYPEEFDPCPYCEATGIEDKPILREFVDCLQVILSIGLQVGVERNYPVAAYKWDSILLQFDSMFYFATKCRHHTAWYSLIDRLYGLGEMLNLQWADIEHCFEEKIERNKERQGIT